MKEAADYYAGNHHHNIARHSNLQNILARKVMLEKELSNNLYINRSSITKKSPIKSSLKLKR
jgi:hypothetical protein